jgi:hypothetical protein
LVSGAITILYFITFAAYSLYAILPQLAAFILMVLFTVFAVITALNYHKQIIAHIGLVGAYAVPFLLSTGSGDVFTLFSYMAIINIGILVVAFKKYWKPLYYVSFAFTWHIYTSWMGFSYVEESHFLIAISFASFFFVIFYLAFIGYKFIKKENFNAGDVIIVFFNSFIFYGVGFYLLSENENTKELLGLFTLANATIHFVVASVIFKQKLADKKLFYLITALVLTFVTITIPVQLDGSWVTILWAVEAALLFWIGLSKEIKLYKNLSYILMFLAFFSLFQDWSAVYDTYYGFEETKFTPFLNVNFLSSMIVLIAFGVITWLNSTKKYSAENEAKNGLSKLMTVLIPIFFLIICYCSFAFEIDEYWSQSFEESMIRVSNDVNYGETYYNYDLLNFNNIWLVNFTLLFFTILSFVNIKKIKNRTLGLANLIFNILVVFLFLSFGLYVLSELRTSYLDQNLAEFYNRGGFNLSLRYISFLFLGALIYAVYASSKQAFMKLNFKIPFERNRIAFYRFMALK